MPWFLVSCLALLIPASLAAQPVKVPEDPWQLTRDIEIVSRWPQRDRLHDDRITADLYRPRTEGRIPAAVVINSSGGITAHTELYYARVLARYGIAALVVDSFRPRGVRRTGDDQNRVAQTRSNADAIAGFRWLAGQSWVDPSRIIVLGMSRGGEAAYSAALEVLRRHYEASDIRFAAHVSISPGGCNLQQRDAQTTGAPMFFMLGELDDGTPALPCVEYIERMRTAGNANIRWAVYPGVTTLMNGREELASRLMIGPPARVPDASGATSGAAFTTDPLGKPRRRATRRTFCSARVFRPATRSVATNA